VLDEKMNKGGNGFSLNTMASTHRLCDSLLSLYVVSSSLCVVAMRVCVCVCGLCTLASCD
jgi:hypothetical protein